MMEPSSYSADAALAETLAKLQAMEQDNTHLRSRLHAIEQDNALLRSQINQLSLDARRAEKGGWGSSGGGGGGGGGSAVEGAKEVERLHKQLKELMHVNNQWDLDYKEQEQAFRRYRIDSQQAQGENQTLIEKLKETKERMAEEIRDLQVVISRKDKDITELRGKLRALEEQLGGGGGAGKFRYGQPLVSHDRIKELEEESHILRQQLKAYQDDFNAERRDRERMSEQRESAAIRHEAEITSLKLQLERCRNELTHYTSEANRLSQQLRLKSQIEEDQYKRHLESNGYITRSPSGRLPPSSQLPPFDPFVENDPPSLVGVTGHSPLPPPPSTRSSNSSHSPRLLTRGVDLVQAFSNSQGAQAVSQFSQGSHGMHTPPQQRGVATQDSNRSRSPIMTNGNSSNYFASKSGRNSPLQQRSASPIAMTVTNASSSSAPPTRATSNGYAHTVPPSMTNGIGPTNAGYNPPPMRYENHNAGVHYNNAHSNGRDLPLMNESTIARGSGMGGSRPSSPPNMAYQEQPQQQQQQHQVGVSSRGVSIPPPLQTKGKYSCPRCERKFEHKKDCNEHKSRCMV